jgi:hypothetical protein
MKFINMKRVTLITTIQSSNNTIAVHKDLNNIAVYNYFNLFINTIA